LPRVCSQRTGYQGQDDDKEAGRAARQIWPAPSPSRFESIQEHVLLLDGPARRPVLKGPLIAVGQMSVHSSSRFGSFLLVGVRMGYTRRARVGSPETPEGLCRLASPGPYGVHCCVLSPARYGGPPRRNSADRCVLGIRVVALVRIGCGRGDRGRIGDRSRKCRLDHDVNHGGGAIPHGS
jgi:hypothetical protein